MGRAVLFRRRRYRRAPRRRGVGRLLVSARPFGLLAVLLAVPLAAWPTLDPALVEPLGPLVSDPERLTASFTRCGRAGVMPA